MPISTTKLSRVEVEMITTFLNLSASCFAAVITYSSDTENLVWSKSAGLSLVGANARAS